MSQPLDTHKYHRYPIWNDPSWPTSFFNGPPGRSGQGTFRWIRTKARFKLRVGIQPEFTRNFPTVKRMPSEKADCFVLFVFFLGCVVVVVVVAVAVAVAVVVVVVVVVVEPQGFFLDNSCNNLQGVQLDDHPTNSEVAIIDHNPGDRAWAQMI